MKYDDDLTLEITELAEEFGFIRSAIATAERVCHADCLTMYIDAGYCADMDYLRRNLDKRTDPSKLVPGALSVICLAASCRGMEDSESTISYYARGRDYHRVLKKRAMALCDRLRQNTPSFEGRVFVDTAPVAERDLAYASGLGWVGKNGMLIVPGVGNSALLAEIICNLPLRPGKPIESQCGDCRRCIETCPTGAIVADRTVDSRLCLSYHTIENRGTIPVELRAKMTTTVFGCDRCHDACPYSSCGPSGDADLAPPGETQPTVDEILRWDESNWDQQTKGRATRRATLEMFRRNAAICAGNSGDFSLAEPLRRLSRLPNSCEEITWALHRLDQTGEGGYKDAHE